MIRTNARWTPLCLTAALLLSGLPAAAQESGEGSAEEGKATWGRCVYPLFGNLRSREGTVLIRFIPEEDTTAKPGPWFQPSEDYYRYQLARFSPNQDSGILLLNKSGSKQSKAGETRYRGTMWTSVNIPAEKRMAGRINNPSGGGRGWKPGRPHVVGYTWNQEGMHVFWVDGKGETKKGQEIPYPSLGIGEIDYQSGKLTLAPGNSHSAITVLGVHTLGRYLEPEERAQTGKAYFQPMEHTLLLDTYGDEQFQPDGSTQTHAQVISGYTGERGGVPTQACRFIDTPYGRGLRLYTPPANASLPTQDKPQQ